MRTIVNDYAERAVVRKTLTYVLWATCAALIVLGTLVIFTFDPCPANGTVANLPSFCPVR
jgi:succinate dehydrogenase / fumarate reductase membrane anchor subunit